MIKNGNGENVIKINTLLKCLPVVITILSFVLYCGYLKAQITNNTIRIGQKVNTELYNSERRTTEKNVDDIKQTLKEVNSKLDKLLMEKNK